MTKISPSLLSANFMNLEAELEKIDNADWLHYDVMDGHFVPNISFGMSILKQLRKATDKYLDVHLMISDPWKYVDEFINAGADLITFHIEAMQTEDEVIRMIHHIKERGCDAGIAVRPFTLAQQMIPYLEEIDVILVMSVEPGFGGQVFKADETLPKIAVLKNLQTVYDFLIEVDGGINEHTGKLCREAGANVLVSGSYVFSGDYHAKIESLK